MSLAALVAKVTGLGRLWMAGATRAGAFEAIEAFCVENGPPFVRRTNAERGTDGRVVWWQPETVPMEPKRRGRSSCQ